MPRHIAFTTLVLPWLCVLAGMPKGAVADDWNKLAVLTCDPAQNKAMVRLGATYEKNLGAAKLPEKYAAEFSALNSGKGHKNCKLKDGRSIHLSYEIAQAYAHGFGRGDAPAIFTLKIGGQYAYFKKTFYSGYGVKLRNSTVIMLRGDQLVSCQVLNYFENSKHDERISQEDCEDVSYRLRGGLSKQEDAALKNQRMIDSYTVISKDEGVCQYFGKPETATEFVRNSYEKFGPYKKEGSAAVRTPLGDHIMSQIDINNDGTAENVHVFGSHDGYFDGSFLVYFLRQADEANFTACLAGHNCPQEISGKPEGSNSFGDIDYFIRNAARIWPSSRVISASSISAGFKAYGFSDRYVTTQPVEYKDKMYLYFDPLNKDTFPSSVVAMLNPDGKIKTTCTYKD